MPYFKNEMIKTLCCELSTRGMLEFGKNIFKGEMGL